MDDLQKDFELGAGGGLDSFMMYSFSNSSLIPGWWSDAREAYLRKTSIEVDIISSIINILVMRLYNLPLHITPVNQLIATHQEVADVYDTIINNSWTKNGELFINDLLVSDKGGFLLIEGENSASLPLKGICTGLRHIPSQEVMLNDNDTYPYVWFRRNADALFIHETRVIRLAQRPIAVRDNGYVGLSFTSRAINVGQLLSSAITYGLESLGKIESDKVVWATSTTGAALKSAFKDAAIDATNEGKNVRGNSVYIGMRDPAAKIGVLDIKRLPDSFDYGKFTETTVKLLAIAAGVDVDDIISNSSAGTTRTAALISDLKSRFKLDAWFIGKLTKELTSKVLPSFLTLVVGDKASNTSETQAKARINLVRADRYLSEYGALSDRAARQNALSYGLLNQSQFEEQELDNWRLPNGLHVLSIFFSRKPVVQNIIGVEIDPYTIPSFVTPEYINAKITEVTITAMNTNSQNIFTICKQVIKAFEWLKLQISAPAAVQPLPVPSAEEENSEETTQAPVVAKSYRPKSSVDRINQKRVRTLVKSVWADKEFETELDTRQIVAACTKIYNLDASALEELADFVNTRRDVKLSDVYKEIDAVFKW